MVPDAEPCARHPQRPASLACAACGKAICIDCGGEHGGARLCDPCLIAALQRELGAEAERPRGMSGITIGLIALAAVAAALGVLYFFARPSIERAKERASWRACEVALERVFDAARLYAEDHGRRLPSAPDGRAETVVERLISEGYLHERPKHLSPGTVSKAERTLDGDFLAPYIADDAPHGPDGKMHLLRADGSVSVLTDVELSQELAKTSWSTVTATAKPPAAPPVAVATSTTRSATIPIAPPPPTLVPPGGP